MLRFLCRPLTRLICEVVMLYRLPLSSNASSRRSMHRPSFEPARRFRFADPAVEIGSLRNGDLAFDDDRRHQRRRKPLSRAIDLRIECLAKADIDHCAFGEVDAGRGTGVCGVTAAGGAPAFGCGLKAGGGAFCAGATAADPAKQPLEACSASPSAE